LLTGCSAGPESIKSSPTWEEAKAVTQSTTLQIVDLIPSEKVVSVDQHEKGGLFSCDGDQHTWTGATYVTVQPGSDIEEVMKRIKPTLEDLLRDRGAFAVSSRLDFFGDYALAAQSSTTSEAYLLAMDEGDLIVINSWSECFTLPESMYPGGGF
jgi:hypothetical protein